MPRVPHVPRPPHVPGPGHAGHVPHVPHSRMLAAMDGNQDGEAILALAVAHLGEPYRLGARAPMANADWKGPWDCAEFVSWCVYQASASLFGVEPRHDPVRADAYTGYWAEQAAGANALITVERAAGIAGAVVLRLPQSDKNGHIVLSDGRGGSVEAHSSAKGVCRDSLDGRRWDVGILVPGVRYFASDTKVDLRPPSTVLRLSDPMTRGERVRTLQSCLNKLGFAAGTEDGVFGPQTEWAVRAFQSDAGIVVDGEVGKATLAALKARKCKLA